MQAAGGPEESFKKYGGWSSSYLDEALDKVVKKQMQPASHLLLSRKTFEVFGITSRRKVRTGNIALREPYAATINRSQPRSTDEG